MYVCLLKYIIFICLCTVVLPARASVEDLRDRLKHELAVASMAADSVSVLYNLYDISATEDRDELSEILYKVAGRAGNSGTQMEVLRNCADRYAGNDSVIKLILKEIDGFLATNDAEREELIATRMFVKAKNIVYRAGHASEQERMESLHSKLKRLASKSLDEDDEMELLFGVCTFMETLTTGDLLSKYVDRLGRLVNSRSYKLDELLALYYERAALSYSRNEDAGKAVDADKQLLVILGRMETQAIDAGRKYYNSDFRKYECYRRIMSNYRILDVNEVERYYNKVRLLAEKNKAVADDIEYNGRVMIYYLLAKDRNLEALPYLKRQLVISRDDKFKRRVVRTLMDVAEEEGDNNTLIEASLAYNDLLEKLIENKSAEKYRELQIFSDISDLKTQNIQFEIERRDSKLDYHRMIAMLGGTILAILLIISIVFARLYRKSKKLSAHLAATNVSLRNERDAMRRAQQDLVRASDKARMAERHKTEFINNMSHEVATPLNAIVEYSQLIVDCINDGKRPYLDRFAKIIKLNTDLMLTLVSDVLDVAAIENSKMKIKYAPVSVQLMCDVAMDSIRNRIAPGVELKFEQAGAPDRIITTDRQRVVQVLMNLLSNAAKFTERGRITLSYDIDDERNTVTFSVTDTGIGIPAGKELQIFERFEKLNKYSQGIGLGLPICKAVAHLLKGTVKVDTGYRGGGARFVFTIPTVN